MQDNPDIQNKLANSPVNDTQLNNENVVIPDKVKKVAGNGRKPNFIPVILLFVLVVLAGFLLRFKGELLPKLGNSLFPPILTPGEKTDKLEMVKFQSDSEFKSYLDTSRDTEGISLGNLGMTGIERNISGIAPSMDLGKTELGAPAGRVSETNIQVSGIDEADIVKSNGKEIFYSSNNPYIRPLSTGLTPDESRLIMPIEQSTHSITAFPPESMEKLGSIDKSGEMYLDADMLAIFSGNWIYGYDVSDPSSPSVKWQYELDSRSNVVSSRLYKGNIYLVTRNDAYDRPCPYPLMKAVDTISIPCTDIYYPRNITIPTDSIYTVSVLRISDGSVDKKVSFVGSQNSTTVYMSQNAIYIAYSYNEDPIAFLSGFFTENPDLFPASLITSVNNLNKLEISSRAKMTELTVIFERFEQGLSDDERLKFENNMQNKIATYSSAHMRELQKTGIVKVTSDNLEINATGIVSGNLLNQFSIDEYEGNLRVATTVNGTLFFGVANSTNDIYVLNSSLDLLGSVTDLGIGESIYSARFIEAKGYIVTFRQTDPFYVIDLSDPVNPKKSGELKIPGFSSYLHPINKDRILGVGMEGSKVKLSLFDVSNPADPKEIAKYNLNEYWTSVSSNHHAFLMDDKHKVFYLPGGSGGYIFSYADDKLELASAVSEFNSERAIYLDDFMYILSPEKIVVLDENTWETVNTLSL